MSPTTWTPIAKNQSPKVLLNRRITPYYHPLHKDASVSLIHNESVFSPLIVDYNLYRKFWELQEYFREPNQLYSKIPWKKFIAVSFTSSIGFSFMFQMGYKWWMMFHQQYSNDVMSAFESFKLDHVKSSSWRTEDLDSNPDKPVYFAKYLTSPKVSATCYFSN